MKIFAQLTKVDEEKRLVYGRAVQETPDRSKEIFDYETSVPYFKNWSSEVQKASDGASLGNLRAMHGKVAAGKLMDLQFNDTEKAIDVAARVVDDNEWKKVLEGVYTGFSIGGAYVKKWSDPDNKDLTRYTANPSELSLVDRPCIPTASFFQVQKADGSTADVEFLNKGEGLGDEEGEEGEEENEDLSKSADAGPREYQVEGSEEDIQKLAQIMTSEKLNTAAVVELVQKQIDAGKAALAQKELMEKLLEAEKAGEVKKGMYAISRLADMLQSFEYLTQSVKSEEAAEKDYTSVLPGKMLALLSSMGDVLKAMVVEEVAEMLGERPTEARPEIMALADKCGGLEKIGARNAKNDQERIQKILELALELGATVPGSEKAAVTGDLEKIAASPELQKALGELVEKATESLSKTIIEQAERIKKLEEQPAPPKGILKAVSKTADAVHGEEPKGPDPVLKNGTVDDVATEIKKIHQTGGAPLLKV